MCMLLYRLARPIYLKNLYLKGIHATPTPTRDPFPSGFPKNLPLRGEWGGCGEWALVAARGVQGPTLHQVRRAATRAPTPTRFTSSWHKTYP